MTSGTLSKGSYLRPRTNAYENNRQQLSTQYGPRRATRPLLDQQHNTVVPLHHPVQYFCNECEIRRTEVLNLFTAATSGRQEAPNTRCNRQEGKKKSQPTSAATSTNATYRYAPRIAQRSHDLCEVCAHKIARHRQQYRFKDPSKHGTASQSNARDAPAPPQRVQAVSFKRTAIACSQLAGTLCVDGNHDHITCTTVDTSTRTSKLSEAHGAA
jgi:hypothetical protein